MSDDYPTNLSNPNHNPDKRREYPLTSDEWVESDIADDIDADAITSEKWIDSTGRPFNPESGSQTPTDGRCNAVLRRYEERYGEYRYCGQYPASKFNHDVDHDYCNTHEQRADLNAQAEEVMQTGMASRSRDHIYRKLPDWQRLYIYGLHEGLMGQSTFEFAPEYEVKEFDFSDCPFNPRISGQEGPQYLIEVPHATENIDRELALWAAAVDGTKMELANAEIAAEEMTVEKKEHAQLTSPTENDPTQEWKTLETLVEHPLNMAYSRVLKDRKKLLKYGGIVVEGETSDDTSVIQELDSLNMIEADTTAETPTADKAREAGLDVDPSA